MSCDIEFDISSAISPYKELIAYEYLWSEMGSSFRKMAKKLSFTSNLPSQLINNCTIDMFQDKPQTMKEIEELIQRKNGKFSIILKEHPQYPKRLLDAKYPIDLFYYKGNLDIADNKLISVVGARNLSQEGIYRTRKLVTYLTNEGYSIVSGLAKGTDTEALTTAINNNARVIAVIGTPIDEYYPKENRNLQNLIAEKHLLISQVPFYKYSVEPFTSKKVYFTERNATMAALSHATVIVEAGDTSGTLVQARACIDQKRPLFILNSCFENESISWPRKYLEKGAYRVKDIRDILNILKDLTPQRERICVDTM